MRIGGHHVEPLYRLRWPRNSNLRALRTRPIRTLISWQPKTPSEAVYESIKKEFPLLTDHDYGVRRQPNPEARNIAVIGAGITGLSTALLLSSQLPQAKVTVFEAGSRLGGWLSSERLQVKNGDVLFEWGPRSLRANSHGAGYFTEQLVCFPTAYQVRQLISQACRMFRRHPTLDSGAQDSSCGSKPLSLRWRSPRQDARSRGNISQNHNKRC
jgi:hypothetical protein